MTQDNTAPEASGSTTSGFAPATEPPAVDPAQARTVAPDGTSESVQTAAAESAAGPSAAAQEGSAASDDERAAQAQEEADRQEMQRQVRLATESAMQAVASSAAAQKIDALSSLVLDAADLANRAATTSTAAGNKLMETRAELEAELARARRHGKIMLGVTAGVSVLSVVLTAAVIAQVTSRVARLDATVLAVGKRFVEVNTGLESLQVLNDSLAEMQAKQEAYAALQAKLATGLEEANKASQGLVSQVPQATAKEVQARTQSLMQQVQSIDSRVAAQAAAVKKMSEEVRVLQTQGENLGNLRREVEALVVLQRERYLEAAKAAGVTPKGPVVAPPPPQPRGVQYPRPQPPASESTGAAGSSGPAAPAGVGR